VTSVTAYGVERASSTYQWNPQGRLVPWGALITTGEPYYERTGWRSWGCQPVTVVYDHGYTEVPDDIVAVTVSIATRLFTNPAGYQQESIDGYSYIVGGTTLPEEQILASYRQGAGTTRVRR
jgi:hypothetical protein